jgi:hypothetical protein
VVSEAAEPNDSHTVVLNNFTGGGLAAHKLEPFERSDKTNVTVGRQSVEKNLTKEGLMVGALGAEANPYSAVANVVADVAVAEGVPGAYVQNGLAAASVVGLATPRLGRGCSPPPRCQRSPPPLPCLLPSPVVLEPCSTG